jgi:O-succinylbenzoic acid--CoA ligase
MNKWPLHKASLSLNDKILDPGYPEIHSEAHKQQWETDLFEFLAEWNSESEFIYVNTSGSTGKPKKIALSKSGMIQSALDTLNFLNIKAGEKALLCIPVKFIGGKMMIVRAIVGGLKLYTIPPASVVSFQEKIHFVAMTPQQVKSTLSLDSNLLNHFNKVIIGGGSTDPVLIKTLQTLPSEYYATYGMTETASHVALQVLNGENRSDYFKLINPNVGIGLDGRQCLNIQAKHISSEIIQTNDQVEIIDAEHFKWLGRIDNVINSGGIKLHPEQIEKKIADIITYRFYIFAQKDKTFEERPALLIETDQRFDPQLLMSRLRKVLLKIELPVSIYQTSHFTETENGKINKKKSLKIKKRIFDQEKD